MSAEPRRSAGVEPTAATERTPDPERIGPTERAATERMGATERAGAVSAFVRAMVSWLNERVAPPGVTVGAETALFENGLIDSMRILELIAWTERETGRTIADEQMRMDNFRTPRRIAEVFVEG